MTEDERELIFSLATVPGQAAGVNKEEFLQKFRPFADRNDIVNALLNEAYGSMGPGNVEAAMIAGFMLGFTPRDLNTLCELAAADWHFEHENIASALAELKSPDSVDVLYALTQWVPDYLKFDDARALAVKAIWALGGIPSQKARDKLTKLIHSQDPILREIASQVNSRTS